MPPGMLRPPIPMPRTMRPGGYPAAQPFAFLKGNPGILLGDAISDLGTGIAQGGFDNGFGIAAQTGQQMQPYRAQEAENRKALAQAQKEQNATIEWLKSNYPQYASLPVAQGWQAALKEMADKTTATAGDPATVREWQYFSGLTPEQQGQYLRMKRANPYLDVGTGFVQPDPLNPGKTSGPAIAIDNFTPAFDAASGTAAGKTAEELQADYSSQASKLPGLKTVVGELSELAKTATYTMSGQVIDAVMRETGQEPTENAVARAKYQAMIDNQILPLLRDTFGAQFTQKEGEALRATLGDVNKSPAEKQAVLEAFIEQKVRNLEALQTRLPNQGGAGQPLPTDYKAKYGLE